MADVFSMRGVEGVVKKTPAKVPELKPKEVLVRITHSGLCGTDTFFVPYGCVLGHEGVGFLEKVGSAVTIHKAGDRIGGGYLRSVRLCPLASSLSQSRHESLCLLRSLELRHMQILSYRKGYHVLQS